MNWTLQAHFETYNASPLLAKIYNMRPIFSNLSPRKAVMQAALPICHSVNAELETFLCGDCALINMSSAVHASGACHPIYLACNWLLALLHHVSSIFQFGLLQCTLWNPTFTSHYLTAVAQSNSWKTIYWKCCWPHFLTFFTSATVTNGNKSQS